MSVEDLSREDARLRYEAMTADAMKRIDHQVSYAEQALKGLMLVNGGAIVALFTFIGNTGVLSPDVKHLWLAFYCFSGGIGCTLIAYFGAFFSQGYFYVSSQRDAWNQQAKMLTGVIGTEDHEKPLRKGELAEVVGISFAGLALIAFIAGAAFALAGVLPA